MQKTASQIADDVLMKIAKKNQEGQGDLLSDYGARKGDIGVPLGALLAGPFGAAIGAGVTAPKGEGWGRAGGAVAGGGVGALGAGGLATLLGKPQAAGILGLLGGTAGATIGNRMAARGYAGAEDEV